MLARPQASRSSQYRDVPRSYASGVAWRDPIRQSAVAQIKLLISPTGVGVIIRKKATRSDMENKCRLHTEGSVRLGLGERG